MTSTRYTPLRSTAVEIDGVLSDDQFRRLASGLSSIVWRTNFDGTRLIAPRWVEITGRPDHELHSNGWLSTLHPDDRVATSEALRTSRVHGSHFEVDFRLRYRDGTHHWFHARGEPTRNERGEQVGLIGIAHNVDDQKRAEAALIEVASRLGRVVDAARVGTIDHDLVTGSIYCSQLALRLLGLPSDANLTFDTVVGRVHPDDRAAFLRATEAATDPTGDGAVDIVFRSQYPNGDVVWVQTRGTYLFEGAGAERRPVRFNGVCANVSGWIRSLEERARLSCIVASSNDAIIATTIEGIVTHWNASAERLYGFEASEMLGQSIARTFPSDGVAEAFRRVRDVAQGVPTESVITDRLTKAGDRITVSLTLSPIRDESGTCIGISSFIRDVTQQQRMQAELAQAQKMEAIGQLAGGVAHDLNNILTTILVGIELAIEPNTIDSQTRRYFEDVRQDSLQAAAMIRQLLVVARRQAINPRPCSLGEIVREAEPVLHRLLGEDVEVVHSTTDARSIFVDPTQISQVILNLAANARDAMPQGGRLSISTSDDSDGIHVVMRIADSGCGMSPEIQAHLFEPFFTTKGAGIGTGLGLSATYAIVTQAGGTISVESKAGVGSTFTIRLPGVDALPIPIARSGWLRRETAVSGTQSGNETILIVEDDRLMRDQLVRGLAQRGYRVIEAKNGRDALVVLQQQTTPVDLVITDFVMPEMSGAELLSQLGTAYPKTRVMIMSGYSDRVMRSRCMCASDMVILQKPFELNALAAKVRDVLDQPACNVWGNDALSITTLA
jgi:two-component system, cell cycle sensor histidine kinase and response regulator CckA